MNFRKDLDSLGNYPAKNMLDDICNDFNNILKKEKSRYYISWLGLNTGVWFRVYLNFYDEPYSKSDIYISESDNSPQVAPNHAFFSKLQKYLKESLDSYGFTEVEFYEIDFLILAE